MSKKKQGMEQSQGSPEAMPLARPTKRRKKKREENEDEPVGSENTPHSLRQSYADDLSAEETLAVIAKYF